MIPTSWHLHSRVIPIFDCGQNLTSSQKKTTKVVGHHSCDFIIRLKCLSFWGDSPFAAFEKQIAIW